MSLHLEYRPTEWEEVYGNETTISSLESYCKGILDGSKQNRSIMITGPSGCGKTTLARIVGSTLGSFSEEEANCPDFIELNASVDKGIGTVRTVKAQMSYAPMGSKFRIFFFDECHKLSSDAQEALLKALEEPPGHIVFILCTTNPEKLTVALKRRCASFEVAGLQEEDILQLLNDTVESEEKKVPKAALQSIADACMGSPGIAMGALDVIIDLPKDTMLKKAKQAVEQQSLAIELCRHIFNGASWKKISTCLASLKKQGEEPESLRRMMLAFCTSVLLKGDNPKAFLIMDCFREPLYNLGFPGLVLYSYEAYAGDQ